MNGKADDLISRKKALLAIGTEIVGVTQEGRELLDLCQFAIKNLPSEESEIAENLHLCKCYITDKNGLRHEVIYIDDIRRVTGWEI